MSQHSYNCIIFLFLLGIGIFLSFSWIYYGIVVTLFLGLLSWGVFDIRIGYFIPVIYHLRGRPAKKVVLTFDDGPTEFTPLFLDLLNKYQAKAVFFCIGKQIEQYPEILKRIKEEGHIIGNHTYTHIPKNCFASATTFAEEIRKTDEILQKFQIETTYFRPPYGITNPHIAKAIKKCGKKVIGWDIRSLDTIIKEETRLQSRVLSKLTNGNIILMHDTSERTYHLLEQVLKYLKENNFQTSLEIE
jgi:polysaccharide deacetylase